MLNNLTKIHLKLQKTALQKKAIKKTAEATGYLIVSKIESETGSTGFGREISKKDIYLQKRDRKLLMI